MPPPFLMGAPFQSSALADYLLDVNFQTWTLGFNDASTYHAYTYVAPSKTDLVLIRRYSNVSGNGQKGETVQISDSELIQSAYTAQTDIARIGQRTSSSKVGLVIHPGLANYTVSGRSTSSDAVQICAPSANGSGANSADSGGVGTSWTSPDANTPAVSGLGSAAGKGSVHQICKSTTSSSPPGHPGPFNFGCGWSSGTATANHMVYTSWQRSSTGADGDMCMSVDGVYLATRSATTTWGRLKIYLDGSHGAVSEYHNCEGRQSIQPALRDVLITYTNLTRGPTTWEVIPTCAGAYPGDRLRYLTGSALLATDGQLKIRVLLSPYFASSEAVVYDAAPTGGGLHTINSTVTVQNGWYLFSAGKAGTTYAYIKQSDKKLYVRVNGGSVYTSTNAVSFSAHDEVEFFIAVGNNVASKAKYRVNSSGAWTDLVLATVPDAFSFGSNFLALLYNDDVNVNGDGASPVNADLGVGDGGQFGARVHRISIYKSGGPAGT